MPEYQKALCLKYKDKLKGGQIMSSQIRNMPGIRNGFEKIIAIHTATTQYDIEILLTSKHAAAIAATTNKDKYNQDICNLNAAQAREWMGYDKEVHCVTLNSKFSIPGISALVRDFSIVQQTKEAMAHVGGSHTNSAYNDLRMAPGASNYDGAEDLIKEIAEHLGEQLGEQLELKRIKNYLITGKGRQNIDLTKIDDKTLSKNSKNILENTIKLKEMIETRKGGKLWGTNLNIKIPAQIAIITNAISDIKEPDGTKFDEIQAQNTLTMCASGKDRTGGEMHYTTSQIFANYLGMTRDEINKAIMPAQHTAHINGSPTCGGGSCGGYGTKTIGVADNTAKSLMQPSAKGNNFKGQSMIKKMQDGFSAKTGDVLNFGQAMIRGNKGGDKESTRQQ